MQETDSGRQEVLRPRGERECGSGAWSACGRGRGCVRPPEARLTCGCSQSGSQLSSRLDTLSAEKAALSSAVQQREAELLAAQGLVREKDAALSLEQQRSSQETAELRGQLADKVTAPARNSWPETPHMPLAGPPSGGGGGSVWPHGRASTPYFQNTRKGNSLPLSS